VRWLIRVKLSKKQGDERLNGCRKIILLTLVVLLIGVLVAGCGHSNNSSNSSNSSGSDSSTAVGLSLGTATGLNDELTNADNWEVGNGATMKISNGVLTVSTTTEGIQVKLKDTVWNSIVSKLGANTDFYVEMLIKPTSLPSGNKNFGLASNISTDNSTWYYAGFNANGRMQAGSSANLKGYQNSGDGTTFASSTDLEYYKFRLEYKDGVINFYCNDLYMGKNNALANYTPGNGYTGSVGVYSCGADFEIDSVRVGKTAENQTKLILATTSTSNDATLSRLWSTYVRRINNTSTNGMRVGDTASFTVTASTASGSGDTWTATSTDANVLAVTASGLSGDTLTVSGKSIGKATVIITNGSDSGSKRAITYTVDEALNYSPDTYTGIVTKVYPNIGAAAAYTDGEIAITFDSAPTIANKTGAVYIYKYSDNTLVDTITFDNSTESAFSTARGAVLNIGSQMYRISNKTLYLTPHFNTLSYGAQYYVVIPNGVITGTLNGTTFTGFSPESKTWKFTTKAAPIISGTTITVDGSQASTANFRTVQKALKYASDNSLAGAVIEIATGTYRELLTFSSANSITLKGMGSATYGTDVVIAYTNGNSMNAATNTRPLAYIASSGTVNLVNLTLENTGEQSVVGQAETIYFNSDTGKLVAKNCSFKSEQDTLLTKGYNWFKNCYIEGTTDFIWGYSVVSLYENCSIKCLKDGSYICHARCLSTSKGYVFLNCTIEATTGTSYLARDMANTETNYDNIAYVNCTISGSGTLNNWYNATAPTPVGTAASALVGWKYYKLTSTGFTSNSSSYDYALTADEYNADYASKSVILGRPTSSNGVWGNTNAWTPIEP
jgi:pectate lyase